MNVEFLINKNITNVKFDIGLGMCNVNSLNWLQKQNNLLIIGIDPNIDSINSSLHHINKELLNNINNQFQIIQIGLHDVNEPTTMNFYNMNDDAGTSSLYKPIDDKILKLKNKNILGPIKEKLIIPVYSLKDVLEKFPFDRFKYIDYIKIDAQGADFDIIKSAGNYLKEKVVYITAEPESKHYEGCDHNTSENMEKYLITQDFIKINHPNTSDPTFINKNYYHLKDEIYIYQN
jgi:FkbM family methyltransferase